LVSYYKTNFALIQYHHWSLIEIEEMIPWERDIYLILLEQHLEEEEARRKKQQNGLDG
jgi:hypothetical protein